MLSPKGIIGSLSVLAAAALFSVLFAPNVHASSWNERTLVTIKGGPVQLSGRVLPTGTYSFKLVDPSFGMDIVRVRNVRTGDVVSCVSAIPIYRSVTPSKAIITLAEESSNAPPAIHEWFYPGTRVGLAFNYRRPAQQSLGALKQENHSANG